MSAEGKKCCPQAATDVELLNEIAQHSEGAFEELRERHAALVRGVVGGVLKTSCPFQDREDVESEIWERIWRYRRPFDVSKGGSVAAFIARIARNTALSYVGCFLRRRTREETVDEQKLDVLKAPESATEWLRNSKEERSFIVSDLVNRALSELNDNHLNVVRSVLDEQNEDVTYKEIAERLELKENNVKVIMHRFRKRYMELLEEYRDGNER
jgi:RNA polymerase sigma factor (sigma-70 family)